VSKLCDQPTKDLSLISWLCGLLIAWNWTTHHPDHRVRKYLRNVSKLLPDCMAHPPRRFFFRVVLIHNFVCVLGGGGGGGGGGFFWLVWGFDHKPEGTKKK
jgi:hypothetical protein